MKRHQTIGLRLVFSLLILLLALTPLLSSVSQPAAQAQEGDTATFEYQGLSFHHPADWVVGVGNQGLFFASSPDLNDPQPGDIGGVIYTPPEMVTFGESLGFTAESDPQNAAQAINTQLGNGGYTVGDVAYVLDDPLTYVFEYARPAEGDAGLIYVSRVAPSALVMVFAGTLPGEQDQFRMPLAMLISSMRYDASASPLVHTFIDFEVAPTALAFSPDSEWLAIGTYDGELRFAQMSSGQLTDRLAEPQQSMVREVAFSPDGQQVLYVTDGISVNLANLESGQTESWAGEFGTDINQPRNVYFGPHDRPYTCYPELIGEFEYLGVRNLRYPMPNYTEPATYEVIQRIECATQGGQHWIAHATTHEVFLVHSREGEVFEENAHSFSISVDTEIDGLAFAPDLPLLAVTDYSAQFHVWNYETGDVVFNGEMSSTIVDAAFGYGPNNHLLAIATDWNGVFIYDWQTGDLVETFSGFRDDVVAVVFSPDGRYLAVADDSPSVQVFRAPGTPAENADEPAPADALILEPRVELPYGADFVTFSPNLKFLAVAAHGRLHVFDTANGETVQAIEEAEGNYFYVPVFSPDSTRVAYIVNDGLYTLNLETGEAVRRFQTNGTLPYQLVATSSGQLTGLFGITNEEGSFELMTFTTAGGGQYESLRAGYTLMDYSAIAATSADGRYFGFERDNEFYVVDAREDALLPVRLTHVGEPVQAAFGRSLSMLATADTENTVYLWNFARNQERLRFTLDSPITALALNPDGRLLAVGEADGYLSLWDTATGAKVADLPGETNTIEGLTFSADGLILASNTRASTKLWDIPGEYWIPVPEPDAPGDEPAEEPAPEPEPEADSALDVWPDTLRDAASLPLYEQWARANTYTLGFGDIDVIRLLLPYRGVGYHFELANTDLQTGVRMRVINGDGFPMAVFEGKNGVFINPDENGVYYLEISSEDTFAADFDLRITPFFGIYPALAVIDSQNPGEIYNTSAGSKLLYYATLDAFLGGLTLFIDVADYMGITEEGQQGWVTLWLNAEAKLGIGLPVAAGFQPLEVGPGKLPDEGDRNVTHFSFLKLTTPYGSGSIDAIAEQIIVDGGLDLELLHFGPGGLLTADVGFTGLGVSTSLAKVEVRREVLDTQFINAGLGVQTPQDLITRFIGAFVDPEGRFQFQQGMRAASLSD